MSESSSGGAAEKMCPLLTLIGGGEPVPCQWERCMWCVAYKDAGRGVTAWTCAAALEADAPRLVMSRRCGERE